MWNSKPKANDCSCRRRTRHDPKVGTGCFGTKYRDAVLDRIARKRLARAWLAAARGGYTDDFEG